MKKVSLLAILVIALYFVASKQSVNIGSHMAYVSPDNTEVSEKPNAISYSLQIGTVTTGGTPPPCVRGEKITLNEFANFEQDFDRHDFKSFD